MATLKRTQYSLIAMVLILFIASNTITIYVGIRPGIAITDNMLDSLQIGYNLISFTTASNPAIFLSKLFDAAIFPILTVLLATWFYDFINGINLTERFVMSKLRKMEGHVIVVPYNSFAKSIVNDLKEEGVKVAVIAENRKELSKLHREHELSIAGDMRSVETFEIAGIKKAKCVIACSKDDIQNALIVITAKTANPHIKIISRANEVENVDKLSKAGAHKVIIPERTAGISIGDEITKIVSSKRPFRKE